MRKTIEAGDTVRVPQERRYASFKYMGILETIEGDAATVSLSKIKSVRVSLASLSLLLTREEKEVNPATGFPRWCSAC